MKRGQGSMEGGGPLCCWGGNQGRGPQTGSFALGHTGRGEGYRKWLPGHEDGASDTQLT